MGPLQIIFRNGNHYKKNDVEQQKFMEDPLNYKKLVVKVFGHVSNP